MSQTDTINKIIDANLLVLNNDGKFSTSITLDEIKYISNILNNNSNNHKSSKYIQNLNNKIAVMLQQKINAIIGFKIEDILNEYGTDSRKKNKISAQYRSDAFKVYYQYFINMNKKKIVLLHRGSYDKTLFIYDDNLIFRIHIYNPYNYIPKIVTVKIYNVKKPVISKYPLITFTNKNSSSMNYIKNILLNTCLCIIDELYKCCDIDKLYQNKIKRTPAIQDIFDIINILDDKYIYFRYGAAKVKSTSKELLVALKMI